MNGPQHYAEAERLLDLGGSLHDEPRPKNPADVGAIGNVIALAQVHATLALAAATVESGNLAAYASRHPMVAGDEWIEVTR